MLRDAVLVEELEHLRVPAVLHHVVLSDRPRVHRRRAHERDVHAEAAVEAAAVEAQEDAVLDRAPVGVVRGAVRAHLRAAGKGGRADGEASERERSGEASERERSGERAGTTEGGGGVGRRGRDVANERERPRGAGSNRHASAPGREAAPRGARSEARRAPGSRASGSAGTPGAGSRRPWWRPREALPRRARPRVPCRLFREMGASRGRRFSSDERRRRTRRRARRRSEVIERRTDGCEKNFF